MLPHASLSESLLNILEAFNAVKNQTLGRTCSGDKVLTFLAGQINECLHRDDDIVQFLPQPRAGELVNP